MWRTIIVIIGCVLNIVAWDFTIRLISLGVIIVPLMIPKKKRSFTRLN